MASVIGIPEGLRVELTKRGQPAIRTCGGELFIGKVVLQVPEELDVLVKKDIIFIQPNEKSQDSGRNWSESYAKTILAIMRSRHCGAERLES
jgi:hypothetical protein